MPNSQTLRAHFRTLDLRQIKSGRDNLAANLCPELAGLSIQVIDTAANHNIPRTRGPGVTRPNLMATWTFTGLTPQAQICKIRTSEQIDSSQIRSTKSRD